MTGPEDMDRDDAALAAEYALGLLGDEERAGFETRMETDPVLRDAVRGWQEEFAMLADEIPEVTPPKGARDAISGRLFGRPVKKRFSLGGWILGAGVAAGFAAIVLAVLPQTSLTPPGPTYVSEIAAEDGTLRVAFQLDQADGTLSVERLAGGARPGRDLELWLIADGADAPVSLGVLPQDAVATVQVPTDLTERFSNAVLAISDEPVGGSPTGAPTGDVVAAGPVTQL